MLFLSNFFFFVISYQPTVAEPYAERIRIKFVHVFEIGSAQSKEHVVVVVLYLYKSSPMGQPLSCRYHYVMCQVFFILSERKLLSAQIKL